MNTLKVIFGYIVYAYNQVVSYITNKEKLETLQVQNQLLIIAIDKFGRTFNIKQTEIVEDFLTGVGKYIAILIAQMNDEEKQGFVDTINEEGGVLSKLKVSVATDKIGIGYGSFSGTYDLKTEKAEIKYTNDL